MATLQITYGGSSYDVTRLDIIDLIPFEPVFLQNGHKLLENNITRLDIIDPLPEPVFLQGGVASPHAQGTGASQEVSKERWE